MKIDPNSNLGIYFRLLSAAKPYWQCFLIGIIGTILAIGIDSVLAWAIKPFIDQGLIAREASLLKWLPLIIVSAFTIRGFTYFLSNYNIAKVGRSVVMDFRQKSFNHLLRLPAKFYDQESSGKLLSLIVYNTEQVAAASTDALLTILQEGLTLIGLLIVMFILSWQLTLSFMITAPFIAMIMRYNTKRLRKLSGKVQLAMGHVAHVAEEALEGQRVVKIFGGEEYEKNKFKDASWNNRVCELNVVMTSSIGTSIVQVIASLPIAGILYIATLPSLHVTVGSFGAIIAAMLKLLTPMRRLTKINSDIQKGIAGAHSLFSLLDQDSEIDLGKTVIGRVKGKIEFSNVNFSYDNSAKYILQDINLKIDPGQTIALVGRSGGGKSSLISLLPRFYEINSGKILLDEINIRDYRLSNLRQQFALVSQYLTLFNDTIANNIAYGAKEEVSADKIIAAAKAAHIMDFIQHLPEGLNTLIGENGLLLSGGQRQRIAIARALLKDAPILILDEATSALDNESEAHIQTALDELMKNRTTLVIAHRLSTVEKADKIIVIEQGKIIESGTHAVLLEHGQLYAKLYNMQFKNV